MAAPADEPVGEADAFSADNLPVIQFIVQARIYDVLIALLREQNPVVAKELLEAHSNGLILGPSPSFVGTFITDEQNTGQSTQS